MTSAAIGTDSNNPLSIFMQPIIYDANPYQSREWFGISDSSRIVVVSVIWRYIAVLTEKLVPNFDFAFENFGRTLISSLDPRSYILLAPNIRTILTAEWCPTSPLKHLDIISQKCCNTPTKCPTATLCSKLML